ncbi:unnamed protein product [Prorocentrum cordatum]|uniref:Retrovirus-related Pol polyprotein from transposon TNT 1-94 n=1 Tax=Prorocentrum cordatum TaxID=2364126 RepID=A0ABN9WL66_9DINO|nr:unnamed protein product [Polarella glacialis]
MLGRFGLDSRERSAILTAAGGSLDVVTMREKLMPSWEDDGLAERDGQAKCPNACAAQLGEDDRAWLDAREGDLDAGSFAVGQGPPGARDEGPDQAEADEGDIDAHLAAQHEEAEALPAIHAGGATGSPDASAKVAACRKELKFNLAAAMVAEQETGDSPREATSAEQAMREGRGIVDLFCAGAMGGARALDIVARKNMEKHGETRLHEVNIDYRPVHSFGIGKMERAHGRAKFGIAGAGVQGDVAIGDFAKDVPILVFEMLEKLGAVVDGDAGVAAFAKLAPGAPVQHEEPPDGGHYYMSLAHDLLEQNVKDPAELQKLIEIGRHISERGRKSAAASQESEQYQAEAAKVIEEVGLPFSLAWSSDELKQAQTAAKGISSMRKTDLIEKATEIGARVAPNMTSASLKLAMRRAIPQETAPEPTDYMGFGKHGATTYQQVLNRRPSSAEWTKKGANAKVSWEPIRLVSWLNGTRVAHFEKQMAGGCANVQVEPTEARGGARSSRRWTAGALREDELTEEGKQAVDLEEKQVNRRAQEETPSALGQLNQSGSQSEWPGRSLNYTEEPDPRKQRWLAKCIKENDHTEDLEALLAHGRVKLLEVACSPASILSAQMAEKCGEDAIRRASSWNGHKLGTPDGSQKASETRDESEPDHLWISTKSGPLSTLTLGFNGPNPARAEAASKRRLQAIKEREGAVQLVYDHVAQGRHAHWEWPIKRERWGHAMIRQMVEDGARAAVKVARCQLGVKNERGDPLLKEWLIATTFPNRAARKAMECPGGHLHGELTGGGPTTSTGYYTDELAKRTARAMIEERAPCYRELWNNMTDADAQGERAQAAGKENATMHAGPSSKEIKSEFSLIEQENCMARVSKLPHHMVGEVGPEGPWMSKQAAEHFDSDSTVREKIPGQGENKGQFKGLARVLAAETSRPVDGDLRENQTLHPDRAGPVVWLARAGRVIEVGPWVGLRGAWPHARRASCERGRREISEGALAPDEAAKFSVATATEVDNYVISFVLEPLPPGGAPPPEGAMRARWALEWKIDENTGDRKPKARIMVLGYMGPDYEHRPTTAPTMTRKSRHAVLQVMSWLGFGGFKADVAGAFPHNPDIQHDLFAVPVKELRKAVHGLAEAAIEWFMTVREALEEFGWAQMKMGPCVWALRGDARGQGSCLTRKALLDFLDPEKLDRLIAAKCDLDIIAIAGSHVGGFLIGARKKIEERLKWKTWETDEFMRTGARVEQQADKSSRMDRSEPINAIEKTVQSPERKKNKDAPTTDK